MVLPDDDDDPIVVGPTLCAGFTAYKAVKNAGLEEGEWLVVVGAGGGLGHFDGKNMNIDTGRLRMLMISCNSIWTCHGRKGFGCGHGKGKARFHRRLWGQVP
jgi:hypothetical protein